VVAGTNDRNHLYHDEEQRFQTEIDAIRDITCNTNLLFVNTFQRFDNLACNVKVNLENRVISKTLQGHNHATFINTDFLNKSHFTSKGVHLNRTGKEKLCELIALKVKEKTKPKTFLEKWLTRNPQNQR